MDADSELTDRNDRLSRFEAKVREIADDLFTTGIRAVSQDGPIELLLQDNLLSQKFFAACHDGYAIGQRKLVAEMVRIQQEAKEVTGGLRVARQRRDQEGATRLQRILQTAEAEEQMLRRLADALAWALCGGRRWVVKRFYMGQAPPRLTTSNYESVLLAAERIIESTAEGTSFALLTDLTSIVQVGDLLIVSRRYDGELTWGVAEVKEGAVNATVRNFVEFFEESGCMRAADAFRKQHGDRALDQAARMMRQMGRMRNVAQTINSDTGTDLLTNRPIRLSAEETSYDAYDQELERLLQNARRDGSAASIIDDCLILGVYDARQIHAPALAFRHDVYHHFHPDDECPEPNSAEESHLRSLLRPPYPVYDVGQGVMQTPLAKPIFLRSLSPDFIHDIAFGRLRVFACLDADRFIDGARGSGTGVRWSTAKQARRQRAKKTGLFEVNGRFMIASDGEHEAYLGEGLFGQIIYDGMAPSSAMKMVGDMCQLSAAAAKDHAASTRDSS